jgi:SAM-dependent methyltransferase
MELLDNNGMRNGSQAVPPQVACPRHAVPVQLSEDGRIVCPQCGTVGRLTGSVWNFVSAGSYAESFGVQWRAFGRTQFDSATGTSISRERFALVTAWSNADLAGRQILDAGCGAGRFSEVALAMGAYVTAMDLSTAVYVARENLAQWNARLTVVRGSILEPPLASESFDLVFSIGVLQHTPDPLGAAVRLLSLVRPGGQLAIWMYDRRWYTPLQPKMVLRKMCACLNPRQVFGLVRVLVAVFGPLARWSGHLSSRYRRVVKALLPIASYWGELPLSPQQQREWSLLDTYDWLTPTYDRPQTFEGLSDALVRGGAVKVRRLRASGLAVVAERPRQ